MHPSYGDVYSFPWKRGPHDNLNEYLDNIAVFDNVKQTVWSCINEYDWLSRFAIVYNVESEVWAKQGNEMNSSKATMVSVLRICL